MLNQCNFKTLCKIAVLNLLIFQGYAEEPRILSVDFNHCNPLPEICGNGVDDDCDGIDQACPGLDPDNDGYDSSVDCDENSHSIYPGISVKCLAGCGTGYKTCNSNGSFGDCTCQPLCEAKGAGKCYYVDSVSGNDNNPGTYDRRIKTLSRFISYYYIGVSPPANKITLVPGDVIYLFSGIYKDPYFADNVTSVLRLHSVRGTSQAPISFKAYPGNIPVFAPTTKSSGIVVFSSSYLYFEGLHFKNNFEMGIGAFSSDHIKMSNLNIYDTDGTDNDNMAGIYLGNVNGYELSHSILHDNYDRTCADTNGNKSENSRNMVLFKGGNVKIHHNYFYQSKPTSAQKTGGCLVYKHGQDVEGGLFEVYNNSFQNCFYTAIGNGGRGGRIHHNLVLNSDSGFASKDMGGGADGRDNLIEYNTFVNTEALRFNPSGFIEQNYPMGWLTFKNNIISDNRSYTSDGGIMTIDVYGLNSTRQAVIDNSYLTSDSNCFYSEKSFEVAYYSSNSVAERDEGGMYDFEEWQDQGYDKLSKLFSSPLSGPVFRTNDIKCAGMGY